MTMSNWHVIKENNTEKRHIIYGPIEEYIEECEPEIGSNYTEIPSDKYTIEEITEITSKLFEDNNAHSLTDMPNMIAQIAQEAELSNEQQQKFMYIYMKAMFNRYSY